MTKLNLPPEQIKEIREKLKGTHLEQRAILDGILPPQSYVETRLEELVLKSPSTLDLFEEAETLAPLEDPVLVCGPTGAGKELVACCLHGERRTEFVPVNTTAITDSLFEAELFGHKRGAFTGAADDREGLVAKASGGTLFLDEIGDMGPAMQVKLLRLVENKQYRRVGDATMMVCRARIVCATHQDLLKMVEEGKFREDLYYRLAVFKLRVSPLKERKEDYDWLATAVFGLPPEVAQKIWLEYPLRGNVRELKNLARHYKVLGKLPSA